MRSLLCILLAAGVTGAMAADLADLQRCRRVADPMERLKCYDAIPLAQPPAASGSPTDGQPPSQPGSSSRTAGASPVAASPAATSDPLSQFGLENRRQPPSVPEAIESSIPGPFDGWEAQTQFRLANGQVWEIRDGSQAAYQLRDPKVRISRGLSGTFFMEIEGVSQMPRVRRLQ